MGMARDHDILNTILARGGWRRMSRRGILK